jgi:hypothetical protein
MASAEVRLRWSRPAAGRAPPPPPPLTARQDRAKNMRAATIVFDALWNVPENKVSADGASAPRVCADMTRRAHSSASTAGSHVPNGPQVCPPLPAHSGACTRHELRAVSHGTFLCIECSGTHRSLGVRARAAKGRLPIHCQLLARARARLRRRACVFRAVVHHGHVVRPAAGHDEGTAHCPLADAMQPARLAMQAAYMRERDAARRRLAGTRPCPSSSASRCAAHRAPPARARACPHERRRRASPRACPPRRSTTPRPAGAIRAHAPAELGCAGRRAAQLGVRALARARRGRGRS